MLNVIFFQIRYFFQKRPFLLSLSFLKTKQKRSFNDLFKKLLTTLCINVVGRLYTGHIYYTVHIVPALHWIHILYSTYCTGSDQATFKLLNRTSLSLKMSRALLKKLIHLPIIITQTTSNTNSAVFLVLTLFYPLNFVNPCQSKQICS